MVNCKNCGAPVDGPYCKYCGSPTYTPTDAVWNARGKIVHCWYEDNGVKTCFDMLVSRIDVDTEWERFYCDDGPVAAVPIATRIGIEASMLDFDKEAWSEHFDDWRSDG